MRYKAEIFDKVQYMFKETGYNDHQLHSVIYFENQLNLNTLKQAIILLLKTVPILNCKFCLNKGNSYWESKSKIDVDKVLEVVQSKEDLEMFTCSTTNEKTGPQIRMCLYRGQEDTLSIILNHMVCDGAGFKQCVYLLSDIYSGLMKNPNYKPDLIINGDRGIHKLTSQFKFYQKLKLLFLQNAESNQKNRSQLIESNKENTSPFILRHELLEDLFRGIYDYSKQNNVTINDTILTAYYRVLSNMMKQYGKPFNIAIMIDMRKYLKEKPTDILTNYSSTIITEATVNEVDDFKTTLFQINQFMKKNKDKLMGVNGFLKLEIPFKLFNQKKSYSIVKKNLKNPYIGMTNIGIIDSKQLYFQSTKIRNAFICGSIKYKPHFQIALSTFEDKLTFTSNLYGDEKDKELIMSCFAMLDKELKAAVAVQ